jgi:DNA polymerase I-like protein with 3'-5' exonuclease and polymerase domains
MEWRRFAKLKSGFIDPILTRATADPQQRLHPSTWPVGARTGRFSQSEPNCENIPRPHTMPTLTIPDGVDKMKPPPGVNAEIDKKTKEVKAWRVGSLRSIFITDPELSLVSLDLAQVENRLIAHESQDEAMYDLFTLWDCFECKGHGRTTEPLHKCPKCGAADGKRDKTKTEQPAIKGFCLGKDIHAASSVALGLIDIYGPDEGRQRAKAFNHAASYGMGARTLARREGMKVKEAEAGLAAWHLRYPGVRPLHTRMTEAIRKDGFVTMWDGHVRRFYAARLLLQSNNFLSWEWEGVIREAVNVLAQGGTAVIMKRAMISIRGILRTHENPLVRQTRLVNQVHDELVYEAPTPVAKEVLKIASWELEHSSPTLRVPIIAEGGVGRDWGSAHA